MISTGFSVSPEASPASHHFSKAARPRERAKFAIEFVQVDRWFRVEPVRFVLRFHCAPSVNLDNTAEDAKWRMGSQSDRRIT